MKNRNETSVLGKWFMAGKGSLILILYMVIMGLGLSVTRWGKKICYGDTGFLAAMMPWTALLAVLVLFVQFYAGKHLHVQQRHGCKYGIYIVVMTPVTLLFGFAIVACWSSITPVMILMPFLIGTAEEGMYRGILLPNLLKKRPVNTAILISAFWFSLLHFLNLLGGQSISAVISQLLITFLTGLYFAAVYIRIKHISLLVLQHALWDFVAFSGVVERSSVAGLAIAVIILIQFICTFVMLLSYREEK